MTNQEYDLLFEKYKQNECTAEDLRFLEKWSSDLYENHKFADNIETDVTEKKLWTRIEKSLLQNTSSNYKTKNKVALFIGRFKRASVGIAACFLAVIGYFLVSNFNNSNDFDLGKQKHGIESKNIANNIQKVILPDNSVVSLEMNASIITDENYGKTNRTVYLEGEAFFEVQSNPQKPFLVYSGGLVTEVLGTSFRIKPKPKSNIIEVSVQKGKVSVYASENKKTGSKLNGVILTTNQKVIFDTDQKTIRQGIVEAPIIIPQEFPKTEFVFEEETLENLIKTLELAYGVEILVSNSNLKQCAFTGDLNNLSLYKQLEFVCGSINAQYEIRGSTVFIVGQGCKIK